MGIRKQRLSRALSLPLALLTACAPEVEAVSPDLPTVREAEESAQDVEHEEIAAQEFEIEPGHRLVVRRFTDNSYVFAEVGDLGKHTQAITDEPGATDVATVIHNLIPSATVTSLLTDPIRQLLPDGRAYISPADLSDDLPPPDDLVQPVGANATEETLSAVEAPASVQKSAPRTTDPDFKLGRVTAETDPYEVLRCADPAMKTCFPDARSTATTYWDFGGYYRTVAFNRAIQGNTTVSISTWKDSGSVTVSSLLIGPGQWVQLHYLPARRAWARASIISPADTAIGISGLMTEVAPRAQENSNWCWLATAQMTLSYLTEPSEQCEMRERHGTNAPDCCEDTSKCNNTGEVVQILKNEGYAFNRQLDITSELAIEQALQNGPVWVRQTDPTEHYTLLSDYTEIFENGEWVPYALKIDPAPAKNYSQERHMSWIRLRDVDNYAWRAQFDAHRQSDRAKLVTKLSRVSWREGLASMYFDAPDATRFEYKVYDGGEASGNGPLWFSGTVPYTHEWYENGTKFEFKIGAWLWYNVQVRACNGSTCGAWVYGRSVSKRPIAAIDTLTWANGVLAAKVSAKAASPETRFRYRVVNSGNARMMPWRVDEIAGTPSRFGSTGNFAIYVAENMSTLVQVQACNQNGCSPWVERKLDTGS